MTEKRDDNYYLNQAFLEAKKAFNKDEVPVGCVIVKDGQVIGRGHNTVESDKYAFAHAEINAIKEANESVGGWRLDGSTIYISLEPCPMCAGAIIRSRIDRLVYGVKDPKRGCAGSLYNLLEDDNFNHTLEVTYIENKDCLDLLQGFFINKRKKNDE